MVRLMGSGDGEVLQNLNPQLDVKTVADAIVLLPTPGGSDTFGRSGARRPLLKPLPRPDPRREWRYVHEPYATESDYLYLVL